MNNSLHFFLRQLCAPPHRGAGTLSEKQTADFLTQYLTENGLAVEKQAFRTPPTYVPAVWWLVGGMICGLLLTPWLGWLASGLVAFFAFQGVLFLDWRFSWLTRLPPQITAFNLIGRTHPDTTPRLVLMAHYDSAPVSLLYKKQKPGSFRQTVLLSMALMAVAVLVSAGRCLWPDNALLWRAAMVLCLYFLTQGFLSTFGFFQHGYTKGASDNATGVAAAVFAALRLKEQMPSLPLEVVLTSAEEAGIIGAYYYREKYARKSGTPFFLLNFDTLGRGSLKYITETGSLTPIRYNNEWTEAASVLCRDDARFARVAPGRWHTADFDSVWFARAGVPCLTLAALDAAGRMPGIHRPEDILETVDLQLVEQAVDFAEAMAKVLFKNEVQ